MPAACGGAYPSMKDAADPRFVAVHRAEPVDAGDCGASAAPHSSLEGVLQDLWENEELGPKCSHGKRDSSTSQREGGHDHDFLKVLAAHLSAVVEKTQHALLKENDNTMRLVAQKLEKRSIEARTVHTKQAFLPEQSKGMPPPGLDGAAGRVPDIDWARPIRKSRSSSRTCGSCDVRDADGSAGKGPVAEPGAGQLLLPGEILQSRIPSKDISASRELAIPSKASSAEAFCLRDVWAERSKKSQNRTASKPSRSSRNGAAMMAQMFQYLQIPRSPKKRMTRGLTFVEVNNKPWKPWVLHPNSGQRALWDCTSLLLLVYDVIMIPLEFFDPPVSGFMSMMAWITRLFWTLDILASFCTGFLLHNGSIEMDPRRVARRYLRGWAAFDFLIVGTDWAEMVWTTSNSVGYARLGKSVRAVRILRMVRLLRMFRVKKAISLIMERIRSERLIVVTEILRVTIFVLASSHLNACFWYGVGNRDGDAWVNAHMGSEHGFGYRYTTSLHWSLSQLTGGMDEIRPHNVGERAYSIIVFILGFIMAAVCIGGLGASLIRLNMLSNRESQQQASLRRFLCENKVSNQLAVRILRNASYSSKERQRFMQESEIALLSMVSVPLQCELHFEMFAPVMRLHPFLNQYIEACPHVMLRVCHHATSMLLVSQGDVVFFAGETPVEPKMYIVCSGTLDYTPMQGETTPVIVGMWIAEPVLWVNWMHRGQLQATSTNCRLCAIDALKFQEIVSQFEHTGFNPWTYARHFLKEINAVVDEVSDLYPVVGQMAGTMSSGSKSTLLENLSFGPHVA